MEKEQKVRAARGELIGTAIVDGTSCNVFIDKKNFGIQFAGKFIKHVKKSVLRKTGIFSLDKKPRKIYGRLGYIGAPKYKE